MNAETRRFANGQVVYYAERGWYVKVTLGYKVAAGRRRLQWQYTVVWGGGYCAQNVDQRKLRKLYVGEIRGHRD